MADMLRGGALLALLTFAVYANTLDHPFHYDDIHSIVDNPHLRDLGRIPSYFVDPTAFSHNPDNAMYRPLLLVGFALNYAIGGYEVLGYHFVSIALHLACALLVGWMTAQLCANQRAGWFAAALFAVHPVHSEPVNYISSRSEIQAAFFVLLGFAAYLRCGPRRGWWVCLAFAAGLLSKSIAIVLPALLLAYELCVRRRWPDRGLCAVLAGLSACYLLAVRSLVLRATVGEPVRPYDEQIWTQVKAVVFYLKLLLWPSGLSVDHQFLLSDTLFDPIAGSAACFVASLMWWAYRQRQRHGVAGFALAWFFIALAPASLVPLNVLINEHRLYLPGAALSLVAAYGGLALRDKIGARGTAGLGLALVVAGSWATVQRNEVWRDEYALWGDAAAKGPLMARPSIYLAGAYARDGRIDEAIAAIGQALRLDPGFAPGYVQLAEWYLERDQVDPADTAVERGLAIDGENADLWGLRAELHRARGEWEQSLVAYERAVDLKPDDPALRNNLGNTYQVLGRSREALVQHQRALALVPGDPETLLNMGNALEMDGLYGQAIDHYRRAVAGHRDFAGAWLNMGLVYEKMHQSENALAAYAKAVQLDPTYAPQVAARRRAMGHGP